jgi:hypothetical protein
MRGRKLSRKEALAEYLVYRSRTCELLQMFQILLDLKGKKYVPQNQFSRTPAATVQNMLVGIFASFMETNKQALNVFDVWVALYPNEEIRIEETWKKIEPYIGLVRDFRNNVSFHASRNLRGYVKSLRAYEGNEKLIAFAMKEFGQLSTDLLRKESKALPNLWEDAGPILKEVGLSESEIERLKDYFLS